LPIRPGVTTATIRIRWRARISADPDEFRHHFLRPGPQLREQKTRR
jgi:hypothetical protein